MNNVMIDLETLGSSYNAVIVQLAAVKFNFTNGVYDEFSVNIDPFSCKEFGLTTDKRTLEWWSTQPKEVIDNWKKNPVELRTALEMFSEWYGPKSIPTWSKGVAFDFPILDYAHKVVDMKTPYHYRHVNDYRTLINVLKINDMKQNEAGLHIAINDCKHQVEVLLPILKSLEEE